MKASEIIALIALVISVLGFLYTRYASIRASKVGLVNHRLQVINLVSEAYGDVAKRGIVNAKTADSLRDAYQLSRLVFRSVSDKLETLHKVAFGLKDGPDDQHIEQYQNKKDHLKSELKDMLDRMWSEGSVST